MDVLDDILDTLNLRGALYVRAPWGVTVPELAQAASARYVPQNGGSCTYGVSVNEKFDGDPRYSAIVDGKLYVFLSEAVFRAFDKDRAGTIRKADANWKKIRSTPAVDL